MPTTKNHCRPVLAALALAGVASIALQACGGDEQASGSVAITPAERALAEAKFGSLCYTCHGTAGGGDGPASVGLVPKPRNFQDPAWQASVTDAHIERIIVGGGAAVGRSPTMPSNPDLASKPGVVAALREHIRELAERQ